MTTTTITTTTTIVNGLLIQMVARANLNTSSAHARTLLHLSAKVQAKGGKAGACHNMEGEDALGSKCDAYEGNPWRCGQYDTAAFISTDACCACSGGEITYSCRNSDDGAQLDLGQDNCNWYGNEAMNAEECGNYDDEDFTAHEMCCACGGGSDLCIDIETEMDNMGMGCTDYRADLSGDGRFHCSDTDDDLTDCAGDSCAWYQNHHLQCGQFDAWETGNEFRADLMCCACGGGDKGHLAQKCGDEDTDTFAASSMCCQCGGGEVASMLL